MARGKKGIWVGPTERPPKIFQKPLQNATPPRTLQTTIQSPVNTPPVSYLMSASKNSAVISACGRYRYRLDRPIGEQGPVIAFMLHNPSTADADHDDPTSRRGIGFASRWGASLMTFVNPFAGRATKPADLWKMDDPVGPSNMQYIVNLAMAVSMSGGFFVFAWGAINPPSALRARVRQHLWDVEDSVYAYCRDIRCLGVTAAGDPRHPLYLSYDTPLQTWNGK
jgi:hypothetical protein